MLEAAIDELYQIAIVEKAAQSPARLRALAAYCTEQLADRGLAGARAEVPLQGWVRKKNWDVAWQVRERPRLGISLKSILHNLAGTVPNRTDDLIGEVADVQMRYPEIAVGYIVLMDVGSDMPPGQGGKWVSTMRDRLARISGRRAPFWNQGTLEQAIVVEVDFRRRAQLLTAEQDVGALFDGLVAEVRARL
ncbi:MAG: hypothetical protein AB7Q30_12075 [Vicinamibacteria bacterium]